MSRRSEIRMSEPEIAAFLDEQRTVICATNGRDGFPHLMPLWYVMRDGELWSWTYGRSQKVRNMERDDRVTLEVEAGHDYHELRGVMIKARVELHREEEDVTRLGAEIFARYSGEEGAVGDDFLDAVRRQAPKRVGLRFVPRHTATWDHRKLAGAY
jgi:PPOX class probable F420-dependent enzyme